MKTIILSNNNPGAWVPLFFTFLLYWTGVCQGQTQPGNGTNQVASSDYVCVQRGPYSKVWQQTLLSTNANGDVTTNEQSYTELATGICYLNNGKYVDSVEEVDPVAGGAQAVQGRHQVQWALNANTPGGAVTITTPDGKQLSSTVFGLAYYDVASGSNAALGQLKDCNGAIVAPNQVLYADAFSNVTADVLYTYTKAGLSQDILIDKRLPAPDTYGLADASTILQIYTAFINSPQPQITAVTNENVVDCQSLDFGDMKMGMGEAVFLNGQNAAVSAGIVAKQWVETNNSTFLIESIPYSSISNQLQQLPHASNLKPGRGTVRRMAFLEPHPAGPGGSAKGEKPMKLAKAEMARPRLVMDYVLLSSSMNLVLQGDTTYLVTNLVNITGTTTIEGGTVVKYGNNSTAAIASTNIVCLTGTYGPGVFTSTNDNSVGTSIAGSTGAPVTGAATYLNYGTLAQSLVFRNLRFSYASNAISGIVNSTAHSITIWDCQMIKCVTNFNATFSGSSVHGFPLYVYNVLLSQSAGAINANTTEANYIDLAAVNVTADQVGTFIPTNNTGSAVNTLFTSVTNINVLSGSYNYTNATSNGVYQTAGAGSYYLTNGVATRNEGTASINSEVLNDLQSLTTYPPAVVTNVWLTNNTNLSLQAQRDTDTPDIGYHYPPIDFAIDFALSNAIVTVLPGTVLAGYGIQGAYLFANSTFNCQGTATSPNYFVRYNTVQEQSNTNWETTAWSGLMVAPSLPDASVDNFAFTEWSVLTSDVLYASSVKDCPLGLENCQVYGGQINMRGTGLSSSNCLYRRTDVILHNQAPSGSYSSNIFFNNLFWQGTITGSHSVNPGYWTFRDNLFDSVTNTVSVTNTDSCSNNAYVTTNFGTLTYSSNDVVLSNSPAYQPGALGDFYYPTNFSPTNVTLIHTGSQLASAAGLYHYTVLTNAYSIEGTNIVSIGFHYVGVDANGNPLDTTGDGLPDYVKDSNGDGVYDAGDLANWLNPFNIYDQGTTLEGWTPPNLRLGYWRFNNTSWTNEAGVGPMTTPSGLVSNISFSGGAVSMTSSTSQLVYPVTSTSGGTNYFNPANGTVRFWYQPNWNTTNSAASTNVLLEANGSIGQWDLFLQNGTNTSGVHYSIINLATSSNLNERAKSFQTGIYNGALVNFQSNHWYQIALTYSPTNVALYTNGVLLATGTWPPDVVATQNSIFEVGSGNVYYPPASNLTSGFSVGNYLGGSGETMMGQLDELETFNYPLAAQQVAAGFPTFAGSTTNVMQDSDYDGRSDVLETLVDGTIPTNSSSVVPCRLGYWRFDSPLLYAEQGQMPLSSTNVGPANSWSGTALVIGNGSSQITYPDVGSNGWANVNCRQGSVRFWFKPNTTNGPGHTAPFFYMGSTNGLDEWALWLNSSGTSISFVTASNGVTVTHFNASCNLTSPTNWTQIVLIYGTNGSLLYLNGSQVTMGYVVTNWPSLTNRQLGFVIGNNLSNNASINGQFEEMETFNYQLAPSDILANFQIVTNVDSDLDGIPDLLEDIHFSYPHPFLGAPVVITSTIEAEQFDMGGRGVAYSNTFSHPASSYRPTGMHITNCDDLGGGYCLDQTQQGDWTKYTINVLVPQTYTVETRVACNGTNGAFEVEFGVDGANYTNTGPLVIPNTNWLTMSTNVWLQQGTNVVTLLMLTNALLTTNVGRFNYISIYPYLPTPNVGSGNQYPTLSTNTNYAAASNNAVLLQNAVNGLGSGGGTVWITNGTYFVAQANPNETNDAWQNAAVYITNSNVKIAREGMTSTTLIAYNRVTTVFSLGADQSFHQTQCTNFTLRDMTIEAQPHKAVSNVTNSVYQARQFFPTGGDGDAGALTIFYGVPGIPGLTSNEFAYNILVTNCQFLSADRPIVMPFYVSNIMVRACNFIPSGGTDTWGSNNVYTGQTSTTVEVGIYGRGGPNYNLVVLENTYNGNSLMTTTNTTNATSWLAPDGFVAFQGEGNAFIARNFITNNALEAVQLTAGPNSVVGNTFYTFVNGGSCCALNGYNGNQPGLTGYNAINYSTCFIGNSVYGGQTGEYGGQSDGPFTINFSGNSLNLYPAFDSSSDYPGAAVYVALCQAANVCGNTLVAGGHGFCFSDTNTSALILNNNFGAAAYRGIGYRTTGDSLNAAQIFGNTLGQGVSFHVQLTYTNSFGWFLGSNTYFNASTNRVSLFTDPASSAIHIFN